MKPKVKTPSVVTASATNVDENKTKKPEVEVQTPLLKEVTQFHRLLEASCDCV